MFKTTPAATPTAAQLAARGTFGAALIAGAGVLVANARGGGAPAAIVLPAIWLAAGLAATIVGRWPRRRPARTATPRALGISTALLSIGVALLAPLTLHLPVVAIVSGARAFDIWVELSVLVTGPTHLVFAALAGQRAHALAAGDPEPIGLAAIYLICVGVACVPYGLLVLPELLVAITGLPLLPLLRYQATVVRRERAALPAQLPPAMAIA